MDGPLSGLRVVEIAAMGPAPFAAMVLADLGADVIRIERLGGSGTPFGVDLLGRSRRSVAIDLKHPDASAVVQRLVEGADVLIEGFRPGVAEDVVVDRITYDMSGPGAPQDLSAVRYRLHVPIEIVEEG